MGGPQLLAAWGASCVPFALGAWAQTPPLPGASRTALVLLPWLALAGWPPGDGRRTGLTAALVVPACALPPLGVALALDGAARGGRVAALGLALVTAWSLAAALACRCDARGRGVYRALWSLLVPGLPLLALGLGWAPAAGGPAVGPDWAGWVARLSPLAWCVSWAGAERSPAASGAAAHEAAVAGGVALGAALLVGCAVAWLAARERQEPSA